MTTKLTLTIDSKVIQKAKIFAKFTGRSLSGLVESYLDQVTKDDAPQESISPKLENLVGSVPLPNNFDEKEELRKYYETKHL